MCHMVSANARSEACDIKRHFKSAHIAFKGNLVFYLTWLATARRPLATARQLDSSTGWRQLELDRRQLDRQQLAGDSSTA